MLVDADDAYGDAKNVTRVVQAYEAMGASAIFLEDQQAPKRCGHMLGKKVVPAEVHVGKIRASAAMRHNPETFIMARTDALAPLGLDEALRRAELSQLAQRSASGRAHGRARREVPLTCSKSAGRGVR